MMLPSQVTLIPLFIIFSKLGWVNTLTRWSFPSSLAMPLASFCCDSLC